ncbi:MAG: RluA family pseudouridine synthase [Acidiferrobacterales bacterium]|nr:RluA family pseudouridine synthase [Acidiferrobacterales bacterium]
METPCATTTLIPLNSEQTAKSRGATTVEVTLDCEDRRLDNFMITELPGVPRSHVYSLIRTGQVRVNSKRAKVHHRLKAGDRVRIPPVRIADRTIPTNVNPNLKRAIHQIIFEDESLIAVDKAAGIAVHSGTNHRLGLIEAMRVERPDLEYVELVHRLDKHTSGILLLAKNKRVLRELHSMLRRDGHEDHAITKKYLALVKGIWRGGEREIKTSDLDSASRLKSGKTARKLTFSTFRPTERFAACSLVDITLHTGKTHQARRHAVTAGHPIAGDQTYGIRQFNTEMRNYGLNRLFLHAYSLTFSHPANGESISLECKLPQELIDVLDNLKQSCRST